MDDDDEGRPFGITLLGVLALIGGIVLVFVGIVLMGVIAFGDMPTGNGTFLAGALTSAVGLLYMGVAAGAWFGFPWARIAGIVTAVIGLVVSAAGLILHGSIGHAFATVVFPLFLLWYLNRASVKAAFRKEA